jgi:hypothetical protein
MRTFRYLYTDLSMYIAQELDISIQKNKEAHDSRVKYMNTMAPGFEALVRTALEACVWTYNANTVIIRALKVLYMSPFCQGGWDKVGVNGTKVRWLLAALNRDDQ